EQREPRRGDGRAHVHGDQDVRERRQVSVERDDPDGPELLPLSGPARVHFMADLPAISLGLVFGFGQGVRHAFEPDHVVAVSTMMSRRTGVRARVGYAMAWGLGHAAILVVVGAVLMTLRAELPARLDAAFELAVALMLIAL